MKDILKAVVLCCALLATPFASASTLQPVINYENQAIRPASGKTPSMAQVKAAIEKAAKAPIPSARNQSWELKEVAAGMLVATLNVRGKHTVMVTIAFSPNAYSVNYKDSINMHYAPIADTVRYSGMPVNYNQSASGFEIHSYYNAWVKALVNNISFETQKL